MTKKILSIFKKKVGGGSNYICKVVLSNMIVRHNLCPVIILKMISWKSVQGTNAKMNKDFALILIEISVYKHIRKTDCALGIG